MATWIWAIVAAGAVAVLFVVVLGLVRARRRRGLRRQFGPEYDRTLDRAGSKSGAEAELAGRAERRRDFEVRSLPPGARRSYAVAWQDVQARFVDSPADCVEEADVLVTRLLRERGYPVDDFGERSDLVSVDHPDVVEDYRGAHRVAVAETAGKATTEDRRQAMVHFRSLFTALLGRSQESEAGVPS